MQIVYIIGIVVGLAIVVVFLRWSNFAHNFPGEYLERAHRTPILGALPDNFLLGIVDILFALYTIALAGYVIWAIRALTEK